MRWTRMLVTATTAIAFAGSAACRGDDAVGPDGSGGADSLRALPRALSTAEVTGIAASNRFSLNLLKSVSRVRTGNVLLSPFSVSVALGLTMNGASGETESAMRRVLGWGAQPREEINTAYRGLFTLLPTLDESVTMRSVNGVWARSDLPLHPDFSRDAQQYFSATLGSSATPRGMYDAVNQWASRATEGMIPKALEGEPPPDLEMLLANALLFKGQWRNRFDAANTRAGEFTLETGARISVPMMSGSFPVRGASTNAYQAVELSYGNTAYAMTLVIPNSGTIGAFVAGLDSAQFAGIFSGLRESGSELPISLPRFKVAGTIELADPLRDLGMGIAFTDAARFDRLFASGGGHALAFVKHSVAIDVDEQGTKAAAVTVVGVRPTSAPAPFAVNRSFLFLIRERFSGTVLFAGIVRDPRA